MENNIEWILVLLCIFSTFSELNPYIGISGHVIINDDMYFMLHLSHFVPYIF